MTLTIWFAATFVVSLLLLHLFGKINVLPKVAYHAGVLAIVGLSIFVKYLATEDFSITQAGLILLAGSLALLFFAITPGFPRLFILAHGYAEDEKFDLVARRIKYRKYDILRVTNNKEWISKAVRDKWVYMLLVSASFIGDAGAELTKQLRLAKEFEGLKIVPLSHNTQRAQNFFTTYPWAHLEYSLNQDKLVPSYNEPAALRQLLA